MTNVVVCRLRVMEGWIRTGISRLILPKQALTRLDLECSDPAGPFDERKREIGKSACDYGMLDE